jgi:hypothetical protein
MGNKNLGPKELENNEEYRVEEFINGRPLTMLELRSPFVQKTLV